MRGREALTVRLEEADSVYVPATVTWGNCTLASRWGVHDHATTQLNRTIFFLQPDVSVVRTDENVAERYGKLVQQLRAQGTPIPTNDIWIAAAALETGSRLLGYEAHFEHVPGVIVESP